VRVPSFIVIGGGAVGARMAGQLMRARAAGRLETGPIVVVDRDPACLASSLGPPVTAAAANWGEWLAAHLGAWDPGGHLVPYHWAPHLLEEWLVGVFRTMHFLYGVGTISVRDILAARDRVVDAARGGAGRTFVVATSSHCHALAATLRVTPVTA
jgi:ABC-type sugar transport system substrate-binding protein